MANFTPPEGRSAAFKEGWNARCAGLARVPPYPLSHQFSRVQFRLGWDDANTAMKLEKKA